MVNRTPRYWASAIDIERASSRVLAVVGPVADLSVDRIAAVLADAAASSPTAHIALSPRSDRRRWVYRVRDWRRVVSVRPDLDTADLGRLLMQLRDRPGGRSALEVLICGDYLVVDYSHGLGDGRLGVLLPAVLLGDRRPGAAELLAPSLPRWAPVPALFRQFALHPRRALAVLRMRKSGRRAVPERGTGRITDWESARRSVTAYMEPRAVAALRAWTSAHFPGATAAAATVTLLSAALRMEGVRVDDEVTILVDCRRYLRPRHRDGHGNFAVGIPIHAPRAATPSSIGTQMRMALESGRPLARLSVAEVKARVARPNPPPEPDQGGSPDRVRLTVSDLGKLRPFDHIRWKAGDAPPQAIAYVESEGPGAMDLEVTEVCGGRTFTASFSATMVEPAVVANAFQRMCEDPVGVLRAGQAQRIRPAPVPHQRAQLRPHAPVR